MGLGNVFARDGGDGDVEVGARHAFGALHRFPGALGGGLQVGDDAQY